MSNENNEAIELLDDNNLFPTVIESFQDIIPVSILNRIKNIPRECFDKDEEGLKALLAEKKVSITERIESLREHFWEEYHNALKERRMMDIDNVFRPCCMKGTFYYIISNDYKLAYIICPIIKYDTKLTVLLRTHSIRIVRDILSIPCKSVIEDPDGNKIEVINEKLATLQLKVIKQLEDRVHGTPTQKIQQLNLNVNKKDNDVAPKTVEEIQKKIAAIDNELNKRRSIDKDDIIDAEFEDSKKENT